MTAAQDPGVYITPAQMYQEIRSLIGVVSRVEAKVDALHVVKDDVADHEARLRALERRVWTASGVAATIGAGGGGLLAQLLGQ